MQAYRDVFILVKPVKLTNVFKIYTPPDNIDDFIIHPYMIQQTREARSNKEWNFEKIEIERNESKIENT